MVIFQVLLPHKCRLIHIFSIFLNKDSCIWPTMRSTKSFGEKFNCWSFKTEIIIVGRLLHILLRIRFTKV